MGGFYGSIQVRTTDRAAVKAALERVAGEKKIRCLLGPELNGWVGIYPENSGQDDSVAAEIAKQIEADVLHLMVHDDDVLAYWLWRKHELVDSYWSKPGYFGEETRADDEHRSGNAKIFRPIIGDKAGQLSTILNRKVGATFESERLRKMAKALGISNAVTAYEYLESGERVGIKGWRRFEIFPPRPIPTKAKRKISAKALRHRLQKSGALLYVDERKDFTSTPIGCVLGEGFFLGWINGWGGRGIVEAVVFEPPWSMPRPFPFELPAPLHGMFDASDGSLVVLDVGESLRIMDKSGLPWKSVLQIWQPHPVKAAAISPKGDFVAHSAGAEVVVTECVGNRTICKFGRQYPCQIAFHPSERWLALAGENLGLISFAETPKLLPRGKRDDQPSVVGFSKDGRLLWCGSKAGLRAYEWAAISKDSYRPMPQPVWQFGFAEATPEDQGNSVNAVVEDPDGRAIVFGGAAAHLWRLDFGTGEVHKLINLAGGGTIGFLAFSRNGEAIAVASCSVVRKTLRSIPKITTSWEVLSYPCLLETATKIS